MRFRTIAWPAAALAVVAAAVSPAAAQYGRLMTAMDGSQPSYTVVGAGAVTLSRPPTALRMHVELSARAATLEEALEKIKARREAAIMQLEILKADMDSVKTSNPTMSSTESEQKKQMEQMIIQRLRSRGQPVPPGLKASRMVSVSMTLAAQWPLEAESAEQLLLRADTIRRQVEEASLAGEADDEELSPEEQELAEEMAAMPGRYGQPQIEPGEPFFLFVARITEAERQKAMADAFAKAKENAQSLAAAAGRELGPLVSLAGEGGGRSNIGSGSFGYEYANYIQQMIGRVEGPASGQEADRAEAIARDANAIKFGFLVRAMFALKDPKATSD